MRHDWEAISLVKSEWEKGPKRKCRNCGAVQFREDCQEWGRVVGYVWRPLVGRCKPVVAKKTKKLTIDTIELPPVLPCPCCGEAKPLYRNEKGSGRGLLVGCMGAMSYGVECFSCGLEIERELPELMPKGISDMDALEKAVLKKAIEAWNQRAIPTETRLDPEFFPRKRN